MVSNGKDVGEDVQLLGKKLKGLTPSSAKVPTCYQRALVQDISHSILPDWKNLMNVARALCDKKISVGKKGNFTAMMYKVEV